jgi:hypothetical protein
LGEDDIRAAYLRDIVRTFRYYKSLGDGALAQVAERDLHATLDPVDNSIAVTVKHVAGNLRSRFTGFLTSDGEKPDRNRDGEFEMPQRASRDEVLRWWESGWTIALASIEALAREDLDRTITIRGEEFVVVEALNRAIAHTAYHVGQIVYLARHFAGAGWQTLTIPKGKSAEFSAATYKDRAERLPPGPRK